MIGTLGVALGFIMPFLLLGAAVVLVVGTLDLIWSRHHMERRAVR